MINKRHKKYLIRDIGFDNGVRRSVGNGQRLVTMKIPMMKKDKANDDNDDDDEDDDEDDNA